MSVREKQIEVESEFHWSRVILSENMRENGGKYKIKVVNIYNT